MTVNNLTMTINNLNMIINNLTMTINNLNMIINNLTMTINNLTNANGASKNLICPYNSITTVILPNINVEHLELLRPWGPSLRASSLTLEAPGSHDTMTNTLSTQTLRGQELLGHI